MKCVCREAKYSRHSSGFRLQSPVTRRLWVRDADLSGSAAPTAVTRTGAFAILPVKNAWILPVIRRCLRALVVSLPAPRATNRVFTKQQLHIRGANSLSNDTP